MSITREERVVAAHFAAKQHLSGEDAREFAAYFSDANASKLDEISMLLARLHAPRLQRGVMRSGKNDLQVTSLSPVEFDQRGEWFRKGVAIGKSRQFYKPIQPYEMQARVAYDVVYTTIFDILARRHHIIALHESEHSVELFFPIQCNVDLDTLWSDVAEELFSLHTLQNTFVALMKSIKLTNRGFSAIQTPIISRSQAEVLAGFDLVNLRSLMTGDNKRRRIIAITKATLQEADLDTKERSRLEKLLADTEQQLSDRLERYTRFYDQWSKLVESKPAWARAVEKAERLFESGAEQPTAGQQIAKAGAKIGKAVQQITDLGELVEEEKYATLAPLLSPSPLSASVLPGGDSDTKVCYCCGQMLAKKEQAFKANTFIFAAPSQRLQSGGSQKEPNVCGTCAAVSFISPIKLGEGRLVLRLRSIAARGEEKYMPDSQLRMFALGDLNVVAGRYAMLQANETIGNDLLIDKLGAVQYAIYKIATIFSSPTVFHEYEPEIIIGDTVVRLASRHVIWIQLLVDIFNLNRSWTDKSHFGALGRAIRYIQHDQIVHAVYELLRTSVISVQQINYIKSIQLEDLNASHWKELYAMTDRTKARFYQDIAAMTGLHYAFCRYIYSQTTDNDRRIAVRKAIERSDDPYQFNYTEASETKQVKAILRRDAASYFIYEQAGNLLAELNVDLEDRRSFADEQRQTLKLENQEATQLYIDDIIKAHTYLVENRYVTPKAQREFFYALKLSLHTRFPDLLERKKENE